MEKPFLVLVDEKDFYHPEPEPPPVLMPLYRAFCRIMDFFLWFEPDPQRVTIPLLTAYARHAGFSTEVVRNVDTRFLQQLRFIALLRQKPAAVGLTTVSLKKLATARRIAALVRRHSPESLLIFGGYAAQYVPEFRKLADLTVTGYGERALVDILNLLKTGGKSAVLDAAKPDAGGARVWPGDLYYRDDAKMLPPDWSVAARRPKHFIIEASRGCKFNCLYCNFPGRKRQVYRPAEDVADELERDVREFGARRFDFVDSSLTSDAAYVRRLCGLMRERGLAAGWNCFARVADFARDPDLAVEMKRAGCLRIFLGIESIDDGILARMRKGCNREQIEAGLAALERAGLPLHANFIVGYPGETEATVAETVEFILKHRFKSANLSALLVPEELYEYARQHPAELLNLRGSTPRNWKHDTMDFAKAVDLIDSASLKINWKLKRLAVFTLSTNVPEQESGIIPPV